MYPELINYKSEDRSTHQLGTNLSPVQIFDFLGCFSHVLHQLFVPLQHAAYSGEHLLLCSALKFQGASEPLRHLWPTEQQEGKARESIHRKKMPLYLVYVCSMKFRKQRSKCCGSPER